MKSNYPIKRFTPFLMSLFLIFGGILPKVNAQSQFKSSFQKSKQSKIGCTEIKLIYPNNEVEKAANQVFVKYQNSVQYIQQLTGVERLKTTQLFLSPSSEITYSLLLNGNKFVVNLSTFNQADLEKTVFFEIPSEIGEELGTRFTNSNFLKEGMRKYLAWQVANHFMQESKFVEDDLSAGELLASSEIIFSNLKTFKEKTNSDDSIHPFKILKQFNLLSASNKTSTYLFFQMMNKIRSRDEKNHIKNVIQMIENFKEQNKRQLNADDFEKIIKKAYQAEVFEKPIISEKRKAELFEKLLSNSAADHNLRLVVSFAELPNNADVIKKIIPFVLQKEGNLPFAVALYKKRQTKEFQMAIDKFLADTKGKYSKNQILKMIVDAVKLQTRFEKSN